MPGVTRSVFTEPDDYLAALKPDGALDLTVVGAGLFRAALTRISLPRMSLSAGEESLARIAWTRVPAGQVRIALPAREGTVRTRDGVANRVDELIVVTAGECLWESTHRPSRWRIVLCAASALRHYGEAMTGGGFEIPRGHSRWRPSRAHLRQLSMLHNAAMREARSRPGFVFDAEAARGVELDLLAALVPCLSGPPAG